jgi:transposase-like protein
MVLSLSAKGLTHGEIAAHLAEVYGAEVSKQTISTITDKVMDGMTEWQSRPLDRVYPVLFVDAINVKIRDGKVANRPIYVVMAVTVDGTPATSSASGPATAARARSTGCTCSPS